MALPTFDEDVEIISQLSDYPNDDDGLEPDELKAKFDLAAVLLKEYINEILLPAVDSAIEAAARGITFGGLSGTVLQAGSVYSGALSSEEGNEAVDTGNIRARAVTLAKLSAELQTLLTNIETRANTAYNKANSLATVASTGAYSDLQGKPTIDTALSNESTNAVQNAVIKTETDAIRVLIATKQDLLTLSNTIANDDSIPYNSAVYAAVQTLSNAINSKADGFNWDATPINGSLNAVRSNGIYQALLNKQDKLNIDSSFIDGSTNPVESQAIKTALDGKQATLTFDSTPTANSNNPVTSKGILTELNKKLTKTKVSGKSLASGTSSWTITGVTGVTTSNEVFVKPDPANDTGYKQWIDHNVRCYSQAADTLYFKADSATTAAIPLNILIIN